MIKKINNNMYFHHKSLLKFQPNMVSPPFNYNKITLLS
ncbi:hypothetical protein HS3_01189 [Bacillus subtilis]|nr:hypothetical protein HS3_01189 [Bacillus subtilis]